MSTETHSALLGIKGNFEKVRYASDNLIQDELMNQNKENEPEYRNETTNEPEYRKMGKKNIILPQLGYQGFGQRIQCT